MPINKSVIKVIAKKPAKAPIIKISPCAKLIRPLREGSPKTIIGSAVGLAFIIFAAVFGKGSFQMDTALLFLP